MITIGVVYYNQPEMLLRHFEAWQAYADRAEFVVVDDCSRVVPRNCPSYVKIFRITTDIPWNQTGARNLVHYVASNDWVMSMDCDHVLPLEAFNQLDELHLDDELDVYFLARKFSHGNKEGKMHSSFLCNRHTFLAVGGHDEDLAGHYGGVDRSWREMVDANLNYHWLENIKVLNHSFDPSIQDANVSGMSRDASRNKGIVNEKKKQGLPRGEILRFEWERIQ